MTTMQRYLPASGNRLLLCVVLAAAGLYGLAAIALAINAVRAPILLAVGLPFAALSWGMWHLKKWARWVTVFVLWFSVIVIPIGVLNPFAAMEWEGGAPSWEVLAVWVAAGVALALFVLHILGKYKGAFTW